MQQGNRIYLSSPTTYGEELQYIQDAFAKNWVAPLGENVNEFEKEVASYIGIGHAAALSSGTAALHLAYILAGITEGDTVLCQDLTFSATANPLAYQHANVVFVDSERETWNMDPKALEKAFSQYPEAKAVVVVNLYGVPAKLDEISAICEAHGAVLIEDAAESLGASYKGINTGRFGKMAALSFNGNKIITTSGGGMLISDDEELIKKARFLATQAREPKPYYEHKEIGYNYRMSNIVAGIGRGQMIHLDSHVQTKTEIYRTYEKAFADIPEMTMNPYLEDSVPNFWLSCILLDEQSKVTPTMIREKLEEENIESRPIWNPMHKQPLFQHCDYITLGESVSEDIFNRGLCLPSGAADAGFCLRRRRNVGPVSERGPRAAFLQQHLPLPRPADPKPARDLRSQKPAALSADPAHQPQIHPRAADVLFFRMRQRSGQQLLPASLQPPAAGRLSERRPQRFVQRALPDAERRAD